MTLPPVNEALLPAEVRADPAKREKYTAALGFEQMLVKQLTKDISFAEGPYAAMLPDALGDAITQSGGIGLARELYRSL